MMVKSLITNVGETRFNIKRRTHRKKAHEKQVLLTGLLIMNAVTLFSILFLSWNWHMKGKKTTVDKAEIHYFFI